MKHPYQHRLRHSRYIVVSSYEVNTPWKSRSTAVRCSLDVHNTKCTPRLVRDKATCAKIRGTFAHVETSDLAVVALATSLRSIAHLGATNRSESKIYAIGCRSCVGLLLRHLVAFPSRS